ncbi:hypothetical protein BOTBODRAFT_406919 [Botryobasidium botryosum FD-172 SS1]|uniref:Uncharacterized protein n=1 Tax=Botryobasidium botryosum (strain FD-172 SS1) TaxID=930990 RepID=A0A067ME42_BOTB1|nr:hypothetical protein BOTBODRAFT_406919 [Botryobasidium botryosum FD-172 SS1]
MWRGLSITSDELQSFHAQRPSSPSWCPVFNLNWPVSAVIKINGVQSPIVHQPSWRPRTADPVLISPKRANQVRCFSRSQRAHHTKAMERAKTIISQKSLHLLDELIASLREDVPMTASESPQLQRFREEEARFKAVSSVMLHEATCLRTNINQLASINATLPNEILIYIFELGALEDIKELSQLPVFSRTVSHVCRLWREISIASPALWTLFHPLLPHDVSSRGKESLLDFVVCPDKIWADSKYEPADISAFGHKLARARSLQLILSTTTRARAQNDLKLMSCPAPHLTTLSICDTPGREEPISLPDQLFAGHHPRLSEISIRWCAIPWTMWSTSLLSDLRVLEITGFTSRHQFAMPIFMSVLRACPQLQILHLDNLWPLVVSGPHQPVEPVALPALRSFRWVSAMDVSITRALLCGIIAHRAVRVQLCATISSEVEALPREGEERSSGDSIALIEAAPLRPSSLLLNRGHRRLYVMNHSHGLEYDSSTPDHVTASLPNSPYNENNSLFLSNLANRWSLGVQSITLDGMNGDDVHDLIRFLRALPNITAVSLVYGQGADRLVGALTDEIWGHRVDDILFHHSDIRPETILSFAQSRAASAAAESSDHADLTPLRRLFFNQCEHILDETLENLRVLVPEVAQYRPHYGP